VKPPELTPEEQKLIHVRVRKRDYAVIGLGANRGSTAPSCVANLNRSQSGCERTFEMPQYPGHKFDATLVTASNATNAMSPSMLVERLS
jgi:hypothetical protein